jgi:hypothetical protein
LQSVRGKFGALLNSILEHTELHTMLLLSLTMKAEKIAFRHCEPYSSPRSKERTPTSLDTLRLKPLSPIFKGWWLQFFTVTLLNLPRLLFQWGMNGGEYLL